MAVSSTVTMATPHTTYSPLMNVAPMISSLAQKPAKGIMPTMERAPMSIVQKVMGIFLRSPPILRMSCSPPMAWMTEPEQRNKRPLKKPCANR